VSTTPEGFTIETCRTETCKAPIVWARTTNPGRSMPVDAEPNEAGNVRLFLSQGLVWARVVNAEEAERMRRDPLAVPLRTSHFATCSRAADWRKR
jgi:hypothetical protein